MRRRRRGSGQQDATQGRRRLIGRLRTLKAGAPEEGANCALFELLGRQRRDTAATLEALSRKCATPGGAKRTSDLKTYINTSPPAPGTRSPIDGRESRLADPQIGAGSV